MYALKHSFSDWRSGKARRKVFSLHRFFAKVLREGDCKIEGHLKRGVMAGLGSAGGRAWRCRI
jgi:hypothetical protein